MRPACDILLLILACGLWAGCATRPPQEDAQAKARYEYHRIVRAYHIPAIETTNEIERAQLLHAAFTGYAALITNYPTARPWAAMALRAVAGLHAARGDRKKALDAYDLVAVLYPEDDWEVIQAWRAAGDLLWHDRMPQSALDYYRRIVNRFDRPGLPPGFDAHVRIARDRLREAGATPPPQ
jgi:tetratricopeptide (TPR) repeat protein